MALTFPDRTPPWVRARIPYVALALGTIVVGLGVHASGGALGRGGRDVLGDALWAMMMAWWVGTLAPHRTLRARSGAALAICVAVEVSQLVRTPALDAMRTTAGGHLVLGSDFDPRDLVAYALGVLGAVLLERALSRRQRRHAHARGALAEHQVSAPRLATPADVPALQALIAASARGLSAGFYTPEQVEAALTYVFGVDTQLIADGTYYVIDAPDGPAAAGGWSARRTLYGGDQMKADTDPRLDPATEPARIRAFFVHPAWARRGLARRLYAACARVAWDSGFRRFELMATRPGEPLYVALGFTVVERVTVRLPGDVEVPFARMQRAIDPPGATDAPAG